MGSKKAIGQDIRYRGFLTYRGLRLLALILLTVSQCCALQLLSCNIDIALQLNSYAGSYMQALTIGSHLGQVTFPLLLIASFGIVLDGSESLKKMLITYFIIALITYLATVIVIATMVQRFFNGLPLLFEALDNDTLAQNQDFLKIILSLYKRVYNIAIPGDGLLHLDSINDLLSQVGISFRIPTQQQIEGWLAACGFSQHTIVNLENSIANVTADEFLAVLEQLFDSIRPYIPTNLVQYFVQMAVPKLSSAALARMNFNIFWDLFLYTAFYAFTCGHPQKLKNGKLLLFRCCAVFPAGWLILSSMISSGIRFRTATLPVPLVAALSTRGFSSLAVFFLMVLFQKYREAEFGEHTHGAASWHEFLASRLCSLQLSVFACIVLAVVSLVDFLLGKITALHAWGIGGSSMMWLATPLLLLYSYNKKPKHRIFNAAVPLYYVLHYFIVISVLGVIFDHLLEGLLG